MFVVSIRRLPRIILIYVILTSIVLFVYVNYYLGSDDQQIKTTQENEHSSESKFESIDFSKCLLPRWHPHFLYWNEATRHSRSVAVFARCSSQAVHFFSSILKNGGKVLLIGDVECLPPEVRVPSNERKQSTSLEMIDLFTACDTDSISRSLASMNADEVHIILDDSDFDHRDGPHRFGDFLRCFVSLLESLVRHPDMKVYFYVKRCQLVWGSRLAKFSTRPRYNWSDCVYMYAQDDYADVMKYNLFSYTRTYENLYGLKNVFIDSLRT